VKKVLIVTFYYSFPHAISYMVRSRARYLAELGWEPVTPLKEGLLKTISYFDGLISDGLA
jgi:nucleoside-diphosphate-sugar epimerase